MRWDPRSCLALILTVTGFSAAAETPAAPHSPDYLAPAATVTAPSLTHDALALQEAPNNINRDTQKFLDGLYAQANRTAPTPGTRPPQNKGNNDPLKTGMPSE